MCTIYIVEDTLAVKTYANLVNYKQFTKVFPQLLQHCIRMALHLSLCPSVLHKLFGLPLIIHMDPCL